MAKKPLWKIYDERRSVGKPPAFNSPQELWKECLGYFQWVEDNPLMETKGYHFQGAVIHDKQPKMRAMTQGGLCLFLGISTETWRNYRRNPEYFDICTMVDEVIRDQKFTGAAADLLNHAIIARDLGLADKHDHTSSDGTMSSRQLTADELKDELKERGLPTDLLDEDGE